MSLPQSLLLQLAGWLPLALLGPWFALTATPWSVRLLFAAVLAVVGLKLFPSAPVAADAMAMAVVLQALRGLLLAVWLALPVLALASMGEWLDARPSGDAASAASPWGLLMCVLAAAVFCTAGGLRVVVALAAQALQPVASMPAGGFLFDVLRRYLSALQASLLFVAPWLASRLLLEAAAGIGARFAGVPAAVLTPLRPMLALVALLFSLPWVMEKAALWSSQQPPLP